MKNETVVISPAKDASKDLLMRHLNSFLDNDLSTLMSDYTNTSVLVTQDATYTGTAEIEVFFTNLVKHFPKHGSTFSLDKMVIHESLAFIVWHANTPSVEVPLGTDTFIIKAGKILQQTFAGQMNFIN